MKLYFADGPLAGQTQWDWLATRRRTMVVGEELRPETELDTLNEAIATSPQLNHEEKLVRYRRVAASASAAVYEGKRRSVWRWLARKPRTYYLVEEAALWVQDGLLGGRLVLSRVPDDPSSLVHRCERHQ